jgi:TusA-related sulfurtransferase
MNRSSSEKARTCLAAESLTASATIHAEGLACGMIEPLIAKNLRALAPGQVLEITLDGKETADGIRSWLYLTGNTLVKVEEEAGSGCTRCFVRKNISQK